MAGVKEQERRKAHTLEAARSADVGARREILTLLEELIRQVGAEQAAHITVGHLQTRLGMTKPLAEVRRELQEN